MPLSHKKLREALAGHLGLLLTPEIAARIEALAVDREDRSHDPKKFGEATYGRFVFAVERFRDIVPELHVLHEAHFEETELHRAGLGLNPDYDQLRERERRGSLIQFTCRERTTRKLVGNIRMYVETSTHTGTLFANEDTLFLLPEVRAGFLAIRFMQFAENCLRAIGVREIRTDSKVVNKAHRLVEYLGYKHVANKYVKVFSE